MNSFPQGKDISVKDLAEVAKVHYNTAKKALIFFSRIDAVVPKFQIEETGFRVVSKPDALDAVEGIFESLEMRIVTKMMLVNAINADKARKLDGIITEEEKKVLPKLIERGFVNSVDGLYFLNLQGLSLGSMGLKHIVKLNIPLPWEKRANLPSKRMDINIRIQDMDFLWSSNRKWTWPFEGFKPEFPMNTPHHSNDRRFIRANL